MNTLANGIDSAEPAARADALTADIRDRADPALVRADRVEQLYSQLPLGMAATIVIGVIAAMELHEGRLLELVLFWGGLLALVVVLHALLYLGYRNDAQRHDNTAQWLRWLGIGAFAAGATWGFAAAVFFPGTGCAMRTSVSSSSCRKRGARSRPVAASLRFSPSVHP